LRFSDRAGEVARFQSHKQNCEVPMPDSWDLVPANLWPIQPHIGLASAAPRLPAKDGIAGGELSAPEAAGLAKVIQGFTQALNTADLDKRIAELERRMKK
jgi:hypothetical protein